MSAKNEEVLLSALRQAARGEDAASEELGRFDALASPELGPAERERLLSELNDEVDGAELQALLSPIDASAQKNIVQAALASASPQRVAPVIRLRRRGLIAATALAVAAGVVAFIATRPPPLDLPLYEASIVGGSRDMRGPEQGPQKLLAGKPIRVRIRPLQRVSEPVLAISALRQGDNLIQLDGSVQALEGGALSLHLIVPESTEIAAGPAELIVLIGASDDLPPRLAEQDLAPARDNERGRRVLRIQVVIESP